MGRVVTNVVSTCDPIPLYYIQFNIIKLNRTIAEPVSRTAAEPIYPNVLAELGPNM